MSLIHTKSIDYYFQIDFLLEIFFKNPMSHNKINIECNTEIF